MGQLTKKTTSQPATKKRAKKGPTQHKSYFTTSLKKVVLKGELNKKATSQPALKKS